MPPEPVDRTKNRTRSPSYPTFGLEEAIRRAQTLYNAGEGQHFIPLDAIAEHWESAPKSSGFLQAIAALKQFGLLEDEGSGENRRARLSNLALDILLHPEGSSERDEALKTAALTPKIHRELWEKYNGKLPAADSSIRYYLLRERMEGVFNKDYVDAFISQFRATIAFAGLEQSDTRLDNGGDAPSHKANSEKTATSPQPVGGSPIRTATADPFHAFDSQHNISGASLRTLPVTLPSLEIAMLRVPFPMSEEDFDWLTKALEGMKKALVRPKGEASPK